jgi:hypothetical protein
VGAAGAELPRRNNEQDAETTNSAAKVRRVTASGRIETSSEE